MYERIFNRAKHEVMVLEQYESTKAAIDHLEDFGKMFGHQFSQLITRKQFLVYGVVNQKLKELLEPLGATFHEHLGINLK